MKVVFALSHHLVAGEAPDKGVRLLDVLSDPNSDFIEVEAGKVFRGASFAGPLSCGVIPKSQILMAVLMGANHEAAYKRQLCLQSKRLFDVLAVIDRFEIQGELHLNRAVTPKLILQSHEIGSLNFFPVANARVSNLYDDGEPAEVQVAILNKSFVSLLEVGAAKLKETADDRQPATDATRA
jgi:hypothetical protein